LKEYFYAPTSALSFALIATLGWAFHLSKNLFPKPVKTYGYENDDNESLKVQKQETLKHTQKDNCNQSYKKYRNEPLNNKDKFMFDVIKSSWRWITLNFFYTPKRFFQNRWTHLKNSILTRGSRTKLFSFFILLSILYLSITFLFISNDWFIENVLNQFLLISDLNAYRISHIASTTDNILFVLLITAGLALWRFSNPENETFEKRVSFLFPRSVSTKKGKDFLIKHIKRLAVVSPKTRVTFQLDEWHEKYGILKSEMLYECSMSNLHNKDIYDGADIALTFSLSSDSAEALKNKANDEKIDSEHLVWGKLSELRTITGNSDDKWRWHTEGHHLLVDGDLCGETSETFELKKFKLHPDEEAQLDCITTSWTYNKDGAFDTFGVFKFTEELEIFFVNNTQLKPTIEILVVKKKDFALKRKKEWQGDIWNEQKQEDQKTYNKYENIPPPPKNRDYEEINTPLSNRRRFSFKDFSGDYILLWRVNFPEMPTSIVEKDEANTDESA